MGVPGTPLTPAETFQLGLNGSDGLFSSDLSLPEHWDPCAPPQVATRGRHDPLPWNLAGKHAAKCVWDLPCQMLAVSILTWSHSWGWPKASGVGCGG